MIEALDFSRLRGRLIGISDRALEQHLALYDGYVRRLRDLEAAYPVVEWRPEGQTAAPMDAGAILTTPLASLELEPQGMLLECLQMLDRELDALGITFRPAFYLGDNEMWTTDRAVSVNIPWYLANPTLIQLAQRGAVPNYTADLLMRDLRHETGHALGYAFELWRRPEWARIFGDFTEPYRSEYTPDPLSRAHVEYTVGSPRGHYAQKHPDEDWAETFGAWLDPEFDRSRYNAWPIAQGKLAYVEQLWQSGRFSERPPNMLPGRTVPYRRLRGTVGDQLDISSTARPLESTAGDHSELLRREPELYNGIILHESYFEALDGADRPREPPAGLLAAAQAAWGSWESYLLDLRAIAGSTNGWALTVWDARAGRMRNALIRGHDMGVLAGCPILLACDAWEHVYASDYGARADGKAWALGAFFRNVNFDTVAARLARATAL